MDAKGTIDKYFQGEAIKISISKLKELLEAEIITEKVYKKLKNKRQKAGKPKKPKKSEIIKEPTFNIRNDKVINVKTKKWFWASHDITSFVSHLKPLDLRFHTHGIHAD